MMTSSDMLCNASLVLLSTGPKRERWESGVFEYVANYDEWDIVDDTGIVAKAPWVRDKTYKFTFFKQRELY